MPKLSHINVHGHPQMVDVSAKATQQRIAKARGFITLSPEALKLIRAEKISKGNVLITAELAGTLAAKRTHELIPLCHMLTLSNIRVTTAIKADGVVVSAETAYQGQTGVEMEALTAVSIALLTIYDMVKAVDKKMIISDIRLTSKSKGGVVTK